MTTISTISTDTLASPADRGLPEGALAAGSVEMIPIDFIYSNSKTRRRLDREKVRALAESILEIGLKSPISVVPRTRGAVNGGTVFDIVAGHHRLEAIRSLGRKEIAVVVCLDDPLRIKLWSIDENVARAELKGTELDRALAERKAIYEKLHPETAKGKAQASGMNKKLGRNVADKMAVTFAKDAAARTGKSERTIRRKISRVKLIAPDVLTLLDGTNFAVASHYDVLKKLNSDDQRRAAKMVLAGNAETLLKAIEIIAPHKPTSTFPTSSTATPSSSSSAEAGLPSDNSAAHDLKGDDRVAGDGVVEQPVPQRKRESLCPASELRRLQAAWNAAGPEARFQFAVSDQFCRWLEEYGLVISQVPAPEAQEGVAGLTPASMGATGAAALVEEGLGKPEEPRR